MDTENNCYFRVAVLLALCAYFRIAAGFVFADGLQSQNKVREPQVGSMMQTAGTPVIYSKPISTEEKLNLLVRKAIRARERKQTVLPVTTGNKSKKEAIDAHLGQRVDRQKLLSSGAMKQSKSCMKLHTHDRAICLRAQSMPN